MGICNGEKILKILVELWAMQNNVEVEICGNW